LCSALLVFLPRSLRDALPLFGAVPGDEYAEWSGTSGAAPLVSGLPAMIRSENPDMPAHQVINRILETAEDTGDAGQDKLYGRGIGRKSNRLNSSHVSRPYAGP